MGLFNALKKKWKGGLQVCKAKKWSTKKCCKGLCIAQIVVLVVRHLLQWHLFCREWEKNYFCSDSCILSSFVYRAFYIVSSTEDCTVINYYNCCLWICYIFLLWFENWWEVKMTQATYIKVLSAPQCFIYTAYWNEIENLKQNNFITKEVILTPFEYTYIWLVLLARHYQEVVPWWSNVWYMW